MFIYMHIVALITKHIQDVLRYFADHMHGASYCRSLHNHILKHFAHYSCLPTHWRLYPGHVSGGVEVHSDRRSSGQHPSSVIIIILYLNAMCELCYV